MGVCSSQRSASNHLEVVNPSDNDHAAIEGQYSGYLSPDHPSNVNRKYDFLYTIDKEKTTGTGIKKTFGYKSKVN